MILGFPISHVLAFLCGAMAATILFGLYLVHMERTNHALLAIVRRTERHKAYAEGFQAGTESAEQANNTLSLS